MSAGPAGARRGVRREQRREQRRGQRPSHPMSTAVHSVPMAVRSDIPAHGGIGDFSLDDLEQYRRPLTGYCYRMLGSSFEAEDAVQETLVRAWRAIDGFEGGPAGRAGVVPVATHRWPHKPRGPPRRAPPPGLGP